MKKKLKKVVRVKKIKPNLPKLNIIAANEEIDPSTVVKRRRPTESPFLTPTPSPSPSPSPVPPNDDIETEFDPDNVVIRGSPSDTGDEPDDEIQN